MTLSPASLDPLSTVILCVLKLVRCNMMVSFHKSSCGWVEVIITYFVWMMMLSHIEWVSHIEVHVLQL